MKLFHIQSVSRNFNEVQRAPTRPSISLIVFLLATILINPSFASAEIKKEYYPSGIVKSEGKYIKGIKEGIHKEYYESGQLRGKGNYKNGKLEGIVKNYYESGKLSLEASYINGKQEGITKWYYESGKLKIEENYKNGKIIGQKIYDESGKLIIGFPVSVQ